MGLTSDRTRLIFSFRVLGLLTSAGVLLSWCHYLNPLGSKGAGEAGTIPVPALLAQALDNAFAEEGLEILESPLSPQKLFELLHDKEEEGE